MQRNEREQVLVIGPEERARALAGRIGLVGCCRGVPVSSLEAALRAQAVSPRPFAAGFVASDHGLADLAEALRMLAAHGRDGRMRWVAFGPRPQPDALARLRAAGVELALFDPASDEELRFVANQALYRDEDGTLRADDRVPADLPARIVTRTGEKVALIYNLSPTGAYVATPRPNLRGGSLQLHFTLSGGEVALQAQVMWSNVPGNLRRFNAPIGMGLRFTSVPDDVHGQLLRWVEERAQAYRL